MTRNESKMTLTISRRALTRAAAWMLAPVAAASLAVGVPAAAQTSNTLAAVQEHLKSTASMVADFVQTDRNGQRLTGTPTLTRPGKIRLQYQKAVPLLIGGAGSQLSMMDFGVNASERPLLGR